MPSGKDEKGYGGNLHVSKESRIMQKENKSLV